MFMQIAVGAIAVAVILFIGYLFLAHAKNSLPPASEIEGNLSNSLQQTQTMVIAAFGLLAIGVIIVAAFGIINLFR